MHENGIRRTSAIGPSTVLVLLAVVVGCSGGDDGAADAGPDGVADAADVRDVLPDLPWDVGSETVTPPAPVCEPAAGGGSSTVAEPVLIATLFDRWHEAWLASPAVADLDEDTVPEIVVPRDERLLVWHADGSVRWSADTGGRIWAPPVVADLRPDRPGLEVAVASRGRIHVWDAQGTPVSGFPVEWQDEMRALAAADIDGDGSLDLAAVTTRRIEASGRRDLLIAVRLDGTFLPGFPPNTTGASGCDDRCYVTGGYDQTLALGDITGDGAAELFAGQDNAYLSLHEGNGRAFDAAEIFTHPTKFPGIRFLHDYALAQQGWADDEETANQAHFTNSAPAIADVDGDGTYELVILGSVQNAAQTDRLRGVALWVIESDGTRPEHWTEPFHASDYLAGLWDFEGTNVVAATNQVAVADVDPARAGPEFVFAGFDGRIHEVDARGDEVWTFSYTADPRVLTGGVVVADLSGDGVPEVVFNTYSPDDDKGRLFVLDAGGNALHRLPLPGRGAMPVPTVADADADGVLDIVVSLKDGEDRARQVLVYRVPGSAPNCLPWPTGRGNLLRNGFVP
jgi:hypothetical protein